MRDVIERAKPLRKAKYLCMEGADKLVSGSLSNDRSKTDINIAQWILWYVSQAELGYGSKQRYNARTQDEW